MVTVFMSVTQLMHPIAIDTYHSLASSSSCVTSDGGVKQPANRRPRSRNPILPNFVLKLARARSTTIVSNQILIIGIYALKKIIIYLHLLSRSTRGSAGVGLVKSSKLIMNNDISSTSERIGAITSEHRNFCPKNYKKRVSI